MHELPPQSILGRCPGEPVRLETPGLTLAEQPDGGLVRLTADVERSPELRAPLEAVAGPLPGANRWTARALWQGPAEWLLVCAPGGEAQLAAGLQAALADRAGLACPAGDGLAVIEVSGPAARERLARGTGVRLDGAAGELAVTRLAAIRVTVLFEPLAFRLVVERSLADYLWSWLAQN